MNYILTRPVTLMLFSVLYAYIYFKSLMIYISKILIIYLNIYITILNTINYSLHVFNNQLFKLFILLSLHLVIKQINMCTKKYI